MPPKPDAIPAGLSITFAIIWLFFILGIGVSYVIMLVAWWRAMRAHEKIAAKLSEIADKLPQK